MARKTISIILTLFIALAAASGFEASRGDRPDSATREPAAAHGTAGERTSQKSTTPSPTSTSPSSTTTPPDDESVGAQTPPTPPSDLDRGTDDGVPLGGPVHDV